MTFVEELTQTYVWVVRVLLIIAYIVLITYSVERHFLVELSAGTISLLSMLAMCYIKENKIEKLGEDHTVYDNTKRFSCHICKVSKSKTAHCYRCDRCIV
jgi:hypothetical protein